MVSPRQSRASFAAVLLAFASSQIAMLLLVEYYWPAASPLGALVRGNATSSDPGARSVSGAAAFGSSRPDSAAAGGGARVFIAVKTTARGIYQRRREMYQQRIAQVRRTWLRDALAEPGVEIKFFTGKAPSAAAEKRAAANDAMAVGGTAGEEKDGALESLVVTLPSCEDDQKVCKTFGAMRYFLEHKFQSGDSGTNARRSMDIDGASPLFYCNVDDDTYVIIPNLLQALSAYQHEAPWYGRNLYIGHHPTMQGGYRTPRVNAPIRFHTGAAYCLSSDLFRRGGHHFASIQRNASAHLLRLPDDIAVGYWVQEMLGVALVDDLRFHSHLEDQEKVPRDQIGNQITFGYSNKGGGSGSTKFANVSRIFPQEEDPLLFRALRCFLLREKRDNDTQAEEEYKSECQP